MSNDEADLLEFIRTNQSSENRVCKYKKGMSWDDKHNKEFKYKIVRAILAMSNLPDGGYVIIGVEKGGNENYVPIGMTEAEAGTYEYDKVLETCNLFADPYVSIEIKILQYDTKKLVAIHVFEFVEMPVICKRSSYDGILESGRIYVRPFRKPESSSNITSNELREIIELASKKAMKKYLESITYAGISIAGTELEGNRSLFRKERGNF